MLFLMSASAIPNKNEFLPRLIKSPKMHFVDCGLAAALIDFPMDDLEMNRKFMGHLCESFVVQQIIGQAGWTDPALRFWHYRDNDQVEVGDSRNFETANQLREEYLL